MPFESAGPLGHHKLNVGFTMTLDNDIRKRIIKVLINRLELPLQEDDFREMKSLDRLFGMDSIALIEFVIGIEHEFGIVIEPDSLNIETLRDIDTLTAHIVDIVGKKG